MSTKANILTIAIIVLLVVAVGQCVQNAQPAKAGGLCSVSKDGEGNVYLNIYVERDDGDMVCGPDGYYVGTDAPGSDVLYDEMTDFLFPSPTPRPAPTHAPEPTSPTPVAGCSEAEIEAAGNTKQYGHAHPGGGTNSLTGFMTRAQACGHGIYHKKEWSNKKPNVHSH